MRRGLFLLPLLALLLLPTACGGSDTAADVLDLDPVASAATLTSDAGSARVAFTMAMEVQSNPVNLSANGRFDFENHRGTMTMDASSLLPTGPGDAMFEVRMIGTMMYMKLPASISGQGAPGGKPWIAMDLEKAMEAAGVGSVDLSNLQQDPTQFLRLLRASSASVTKAGAARVRGVATTRYTAKLDLRRSLEVSAKELGLSDKDRTQLRRFAEQLTKQTGVKTLPVEVFVDGDGLLRRLKMQMKTTLGPAPFSMTQTTDFYDFGVDVDVEAPPESETTELFGTP